MLAFLMTLFFITVCMWLFFRFMYPKPPKAFMPKEGDVVIPRDCDFCGYPLAEYRGVVEQKPDSAITDDERNQIKALQAKVAIAKEENISEKDELNKQATEGMSRKQKKIAQQRIEQREGQIYDDERKIAKMQSWFFCNYEHQADFHGKNMTNTKSKN